MQKDSKEVFDNAWKDEKVWGKFAKAVKRKYKSEIDYDQNKPHPLFKKWLTENKL